MTAQDDLRSALKAILGPNSRQHGYKGSAPTWRKSNALGDWVVVNVQSSRYSSGARVECLLNLSAAPEPWLRERREIYGPGMPVPHSAGMYSGRLLSVAGSAASTWWQITDSHSADVAVAEMVMQLEMIGWPLLDEWLSREGIARKVEAGEFGCSSGGSFQKARAQALLLMDDGPSDALNSALEQCALSAPEPKRRSVEQFSGWVRTQSLLSRA